MFVTFRVETGAVCGLKKKKKIHLSDFSRTTAQHFLVPASQMSK